MAFPCNQFGKQEPGTNAEIKAFVQGKVPTLFPLFDKIDVNGPNESPVYTFLKSKFPGDIDWNFAKFLVDRSGNVAARYGPREAPSTFEAKIRSLL